MQFCLLERWSLQQWLRPKDLCFAGKFCLQVPNYKVSPSSQPLPIQVSCLDVLTLAHAFLVEKLGPNVHVAPR